LGPVELSAFPEDVVAIVEARRELRPRFGLILGSGMDHVATLLSDRVDIPYGRLRGMRAAAGVEGHSGVLSLGTVGEHGVICFRGRAHKYQGFSALEVAYPAVLAADAGASILVVTNAAGSVDADLAPGRTMLIADHLNLTGDNPLVGWSGPLGKTPFVPMGDAYDPGLRDIALREGARLGIELTEGVYAGLLGPSYETPAEVAYLRTIGASAVGMSTVHEVIAARARGMRVLGISLITNRAGGSGLSHDEVLKAGDDAGASLSELISAVLSAA
jgi:purine-nucleoside phosphorylase